MHPSVCLIAYWSFHTCGSLSSLRICGGVDLMATVGEVREYGGTFEKFEFGSCDVFWQDF